MKKPLACAGFWRYIVETGRTSGVIAPADLELFMVLDDVDEAFEHVTGQLKKLYL